MAKVLEMPEKRLTQKQLADKLQISYVNISQLERDERVPNLNTLERIAAALDVPIERLLGREVELDDVISFEDSATTKVELTETESNLINYFRRSNSLGKTYILMAAYFGSDYETVRRGGVDNPLELGINYPSIRKKR